STRLSRRLNLSNCNRGKRRFSDMVTSFRFGLLALLIQCLLLPVAIAQSKPSEKTVPFESKTSGFTLSYPDNFEPTMQPQEGLALFLTRKTADTGGTKANLIVTVPADPHGTDDQPLDRDTAY